MIGNPPWINWESLPEEYRKATLPLWDHYGLRPEKGQLDRMRSGKRDVSMLFVYGAAENYLVEDGRLGFVITQTVFKTKGAGDGFRRFRYSPSRGRVVHLKPLVVIDMTDLQPFEEATNRTAVLVCVKSAKSFSYPVPYERWDRARTAHNLRKIDTKIGLTASPTLFSFSASDDLKAVYARVAVKRLAAVPVSRKVETSPWLTAPADALPAIEKVLGRSQYRAREGVNTGGLNGCYWLRVVKSLNGRQLLVENLWDVGKIKVEHVSATLEPDLVYPLLRGRDVDRWHAVPSAFLLAPQDPTKQREGIPEGEMKQRYPKTFAYLKKFEKQLAARRDRKYYPEGAPFYTMRNMAAYALSPWKILWPEVGHTVRAAVCGPKSVGETKKPSLPDHTIVAVSCDREDEAHYICALLNSGPAQAAISSYIVLHPSPHVLEHVRVPKYDLQNSTHKHLSGLSKKCHRAAEAGDVASVAALEREVDEAAAKLWEIARPLLARLRGFAHE